MSNELLVSEEKFKKLSKKKQNILYEKVNFAIVELENFCEEHSGFVNDSDRIQLEKLCALRNNLENWSCCEVVGDENW